MRKYCILIFFLSICICDISGQYFEEQALITYTRCRVDSDCQRISNTSFCFGNDQGQLGKCKCLDGYELMSRNVSFFACLKYAGYGESCEKNVQCQVPLSVNAICDENTKTCRCGDHAHSYTDGKCYLSVLLDDLCTSDGNCWLSDNTFGNCVSGRCTCKYDLEIPAEDKTHCIAVRRLGQNCENDEQCSVVPNSVCRVNCRCGTGYTLSKNQTSCLRAATRFFDSCSEDDQCSEFLPGSFCNNGVCTCAAGEHGFGSKCVRTAGIGGVCTSNEECIPDSAMAQMISCIDKTCQCHSGYVNETFGCNKSYKVNSTFFVVIVTILVFCSSFLLS